MNKTAADARRYGMHNLAALRQQKEDAAAAEQALECSEQYPKLKPSQVEVDPSEYRRNHGAMPRGRGSWAFCKVNPNRMDYLDHVLWENGLYGEAKKAAQAKAAELGVEVLYVCS